MNSHATKKERTGEGWDKFAGLVDANACLSEENSFFSIDYLYSLLGYDH